jgi:hypothetical protein
LEQTFKAPNFYSTETDLSIVQQPGPSGTPACVIGSTRRGPAFVPVTIATLKDFTDRFGSIDPHRPMTFAVREFLRQATALTVIRTLGAGANVTTGDIATTQTTGRVKNAGFKFEGITAHDDPLSRHCACVQLLCGRHALQGTSIGMPMITAPTFVDTASHVNLVRGAIFTATGSRVLLLDINTPSSVALGNASWDAVNVLTGAFKLIISSSDGANYDTTDGIPGLRIYTASLDPSSQNYYGKLLNVDPAKFSTEQHVLWADYAVDDEIATVDAVGILSGSAVTAAGAAQAGLTYRQAYGGFDTRYKTPSTPWFISQPFGGTEYNLFRIESVDDGENANTAYKVTIRDVQASADASQPYGAFTVVIRTFSDSDMNPQVVEEFAKCSLDPTSPRYVAKLIGDRRVTMNFDAALSSERRIGITGKYPNNSKFVRIVMSDDVERAVLPPKSLPFGFRGINVLKTTDTLTDAPPLAATARIVGYLSSSIGSSLSGSVIPPVPFRYKITRGLMLSSPSWAGQPSPTETTVPALTWGVKFERNDNPLNNSLTTEPNRCVTSMTRFAGIQQLDVLVTGSGADTFCNNKFTLSRVALSNGALADVTASADVHMREAVYIRNALPDPTDNRIVDTQISGGKRVSLGTLLSVGTPQTFNRFSNYAKFTTIMFGGFDGLNIMDPEDAVLSDKATSFDEHGGASDGYVPTGFAVTQAGAGTANGTVMSCRFAVNIATDPTAVDANVLALPGLREPYVVDYACQQSRTNTALFCIIDIPEYASDGTRIYASDRLRPSVDKSMQEFSSRAIDNSFAAAYFPDVFISDDTGRNAKMPATVATLGVIALNDKVAFPWFAPAGYNRAALPNVVNAVVRLNDVDRDNTSDARVNPITWSPGAGWAITGQKTLQLRESALDRVNVRRMLVEIKRQIVRAALQVVFEQNDATTRAALKKNIEQKLGTVKAQSGVEDFNVVLDETNNSQDDIDLNKMNASVVVVPTRSIEYVVIDFIVTRSGVTFQ